ncbi:MAG: 50S ribosomal protein L4 [Candidatus Pacearchaeota archaeon]
MKAQILDINGKKTKEITTNLFEEPIREDIIYKIVEAEKIREPYSNYYLAGMQRSASGNVKHLRHSWKTDRGKGVSRIPKKTMWRRGTQFSWIGAIIPSTRGGRRAHPPKGMDKIKKINKKELKKALLSALSYINSTEELKKKYDSLKDKKIDNKLPIIVENKILTLRSKEFSGSLKQILGELDSVAIQKKTINKGRGKLRGRKNKKTAGLLFVIGKEQEKKSNGIEFLKVNELAISDLASNGARLTIFSEQAIKELEKIGGFAK